MDWSSRFIVPEFNRVFREKDNPYSTLFTEKQWKAFYPKRKFIFDYVNNTVTILEED